MKIDKCGGFPGEGVSGPEFDEFHVNDTELYGMIIECFYQEAE